MPEFIEREALIKAVRIMPRTIRPELVRYSTVQAIIDKQPAADVVEVIRCKDCKFWDAVRNTKYKGTGICKPPNLSLKGGYCVRRGATLENDYCSGAKRKDGDAK